MIMVADRSGVLYWSAVALVTGLTAWLGYWVYVAAIAKFAANLPHAIDNTTLEFARSIPAWQDIIYLTATLSFLIALALLWRRSWMTVFAVAAGILMERIDWIFLSDIGASTTSLITLAAELVLMVLLFTLIHDRALE